MPHQVNRLLQRGAILATLLLAGCATAPERQPGPPPAFPEPPEEPRFVYDGTLRSSSDVQSISFSDRLKSAATGSDISAAALTKPYGVVVHDGRVYVSDTIQRAVAVFDIPGRDFKFIGNEGQGMLVKPMGVDISSKQELYVADISARRIVVFDLEGNFRRTIGSEQDLLHPAGVAVSPDASEVYVVDVGGVDSDEHKVHVFDALSGKHLRIIGHRGETADAFNLPLQASVTPDGMLYVVDSGNFRIQKIDPKRGEFIQQVGTLGRKSGQFSRPKGIATDQQGRVYVVDTAFGNAQIFDTDGRLLMHIGERGTDGGPAHYMLPAGIDVDEQGRIYMVDQFFRKVDIFRPVDVPPLENIPKL